MDIDDLSIHCITELLLLYKKGGIDTYYSKEGIPNGADEAKRNGFLTIYEYGPHQFAISLTVEGLEIAKQLNLIYNL